ncbi:hypothetical protein [Flavobacterium foetidum]|uniref:hypothetical protein n=1 Tax=Flavobacterium foetidum TaxID=2026681 RepID=UPI001074C57F|nr:hypothetical protein [Flavobacterium foetidum]KAF2509088.1 hypothetical protein E0W73_18950 [Flavobacterium foetidum]
MKKIIFIISLFTTFTFSQTKPDKVVFPISTEYKMILKKSSAETSLCQNPIILFRNKEHAISGFDLNNYTSASIKIAPNKLFVVMDYITKGYIQKEADSVHYENYHCVIVDIKKYKVVHQMQSDCGGKWNKQNQWVNNNILLFDGNRKR